MNSIGYEAWLQKTPLSAGRRDEEELDFLFRIVKMNARSSNVLDTAIRELSEGVAALTGREATLLHEVPSQPFVYVGIVGEPMVDGAMPRKSEDLRDESYFIKMVSEDGKRFIVVGGKTDRGVLYGVFHLLRLARLGLTTEGLSIVEHPAFGIRMINHWDNMDGSVERGYSGASIFYKDYKILSQSPRIRDYARLLASVGINAIAINNVNVHSQETKLITDLYLPQVAELAEVFRSYGIRLYLCVNFAAPYVLGELPTADPVDARVQAWWNVKAANVYRHIPDFGGFVVKADSENRPGPFTYGRDHADGANMLAAALKPFGGVVFWRCFVYNCHQDWRDRSTDRAKAAYDHFKPLDGRFMDNVILQVKNGPMDFQVREPVSPLYGAMEHTNQVMEFQIAQEYTGQQRHVCFLIPQWKEVLDFDTRLKGEGTTVSQIAAGRVFNHKYSGVTAVSSIGDDDNWTGHHLAQANLFGYGRLMWNPKLSSEEIAEEWAGLTFGDDEAVLQVVNYWLLGSWLAYEQYTSPLGVGWMVRPHYHYGPDVDGYEYSKWGTYHFADCYGLGVDRTAASGTGYSQQYAPENAAIYESLDTCPDELLLFFHHVPYTHRLHSGKTVIQHIYDTHFEGAERVERWREQWLTLEERMDDERYSEVLERLDAQLEHAQLWRDVINTYFYRKSGIADEQNRRIY